MPSSSRSGGAASPYRDPKVAAATVTPKPPPTAGANDVRAGSFLVAAGGCGDKHKANGTGSSAALRRSKGGGGGDLLLRREQAKPGPVASYRCRGLRRQRQRCWEQRRFQEITTPNLQRPVQPCPCICRCPSQRERAIMYASSSKQALPTTSSGIMLQRACADLSDLCSS